MPKETPIPLRAAVALSGWAALAATLLPGGSPLRWVPVLLFVGFGPGLALLHPQPAGLRPAARLEAFALAAPISLSIGVLTATSLFLVGGFTVTAFLLPLAAFATVVAALPGLPLPAATRGAAGRAAHEFAPGTAPATGPATGPAGAGDGASTPGPDGASAPGSEGASAPGADGVSAPGAAPEGPAGSGGR